MATGTKEIHFEQHIEDYLTSPTGGYRAVSPTLYNRELALLPEEAVAFVRESRPERYKALQDQYGPQTDERIVQELARQIKTHGTLHVLRKGYKDRGVAMTWAWFKPASGMNPDHARWYMANRFAVVRQVRYAKNPKDTRELDMVLFLNGIPLLTAELKNALTGQYLIDAIKQYREDRDPKEPLLEYKRCLVHFAVSTEKVAMTTKLAGEKTFFLPFNQGIDNENENGFATEYLWTDVWSRDSLLDLVQNFVSFQTDTETYYDEQKHQLTERTSEKLIFPRFHQRRAVYRLLEAVRTEGVGQKYLIKHSAGSGKSNTISWLAHRLSGFYQTLADERPLFDSVIVVTDRRVLDKQLQKNVQDFGQVAGTVAAIDEKKTSQDLKAAIESGKRIVITTLQKFPVISETVARFKDRRYAVIIDEAHSSQSGEAARHLRKSLSLNEAEKEDNENQPEDIDDLVLADLRSRGNQPNVSFFAFTATPKNKTLELFGTSKDGNKEPFDEYTMRQAIAEGFILNVLDNYTSFRRFYKLASRANAEDKEYETAKTVRLLTSYVDLTDHAIELKSRIMLEHFAAHTVKQINGKARAMLVTRSRLHAVRYKRKFDELMRDMNLPYTALVAFSGTVYDADVDADFTETNMNNLGGQLDIPMALKLPQYRILIVANKYQTGFDEPLLHTMYVDKKLGGVNTVQTLSRLNRTAQGKTNTMVLDFVNDPEQIQADFQEYYDANFMPEGKQTDPNTLYDALTELSQWPVVQPDDVTEFAEVFFRKGDNMQLLQPILNRCAQRFTNDLDEDEQAAFKACATEFVRVYRFMSQIITFHDVELEKQYVLLSALLQKLPTPGSTMPREVLNEIQLDSYKVQSQGALSLALEAGGAEMYGLSRGGASGGQDEAYELLSNIIKTLNDTYGLDLTDDDKVDFDLIRQRIEADPELMSIFNDRNSKENIRDKFNDVLDQALVDFIDTKLELYNKLSEDKANATMKRVWFNSLYDGRIRGIRP
ncbi:DEAD/DEAH box helicase family protein [Spirosoma knui]